MKITYVLHQFLPRYFTGTEQYAFAVARWMRAQGHTVEVFTLEPNFAELDPLFEEIHDEVDSVPVTRLRYWQHLHGDKDRLEFQHPYAGLRFGRHLDRSQPDVVHFFHLRFLGGNLLDETQVRGVPSVVHLMDFWFVCPRVTLVRSDGSLCAGPPTDGLGCVPCAAPELANEPDDVRRALGDAHHTGVAPLGKPGESPTRRATTLLQRPHYLRERLHRAERIVAPSRFLRDVFVHNGTPAERIDVVPYGVEVPALQPRDRAPGAPLTLGFMGSIAPHKGLHVLLDAVARIEGDLRIRVHGRTTDFPEYAAPLLRQAKDDPRIEFRGPFEAPQLGYVLAEIDVLVVPSQWYENTPFVALEAHAAGVPVLAADLGGLAESVDDERNGERFKHDDAADLARRILRLRDEPERLRRYRDGIGKVRTLADSARDVEALYRSLHPELA